MAKKIAIRTWTHEDLADVLRLGRLMHEESAYQRMTWDEPTAKAYIFNCFWDPLTTCFIAEDEDEQVVGLLGVVLTSMYFSTDIVVKDILFYVHPEFRGSSAALRMIKAAEEWGVLYGAAEAQLGVSGEIDTERTVCFFKRLGYNDCAVQLRKGL